VLLPALGAYWLANLSSDLPVGLLGVVKWLALLGAIYGSLKALAQVRVAELIAYSSLAAFSALWWGFAVIGHFRTAGFIYVAAVTLVTTGLLLAGQFLKKRYGDLELDQFHGLARLMPRFAVLFSLFVMAAVGLPPFALFSAQMNLLLDATAAISLGFVVILLTWFLASWYLVRMMQRLLFGRHRDPIYYTDLRAGEITWLAILLAILAALGVTPSAWFETHPPTDSHRTAMETRLWHK
jgi:NADH:ubiquinone oxidoreductase subunit 4 (subunit M)